MFGFEMRERRSLRYINRRKRGWLSAAFILGAESVKEGFTDSVRSLDCSRYARPFGLPTAGDLAALGSPRLARDDSSREGRVLKTSAIGRLG